jgi:hypothetical protein
MSPTRHAGASRTGFLIVAAGSALLAACAGPRAAAVRALPREEGRSAFELGDHGALEIVVPPGWVVEPSADEDPPTIRLRDESGSFVALLTSFWDPDGEDQPARPETARLFAELARRNALSSAVEGELSLEELVGDAVHGFWFSATDRDLVGREPAAEEWRHVMQGAAAVGRLVVAFTLLDNAPGPQRAAILEVLRGARHLPHASATRPGAALEPDPGARTVPLRVAAAGRPWALLVDLPGFHMFKRREAADGVGALVLGEHHESRLVAAVILRLASGATSAEDCRQADLGRISEGARAVVDLRLSSAGDAARATYGVPDHGGQRVRQDHARAWFHREDVCADVHVSKIAASPEDDVAMERILDTARLGEAR